MNQSETPLYSALLSHSKQNPISLHVPGHKNGIAFPGEFSTFLPILNFDVTELDGLDDLHSPEDVILKAECLLANTYKAKKSFFLVNGSTVGNMAMIFATLKSGDYVIVQRNCHKSVLNAIKLVGAKPILVNPVYYEDWMVAGEVSLDIIEEVYEHFPDCKAIILTYPNYYGMTYNLENIITFAHRKSIPVLVDEAHGAHFLGRGFLPTSSLEYGADVVVQSAHKTLPAMTMGSFIHINSELVEVDKINTYLRMLQSSSPSYPIMASLDIARSYVATFSKEDGDYLDKQIREFRVSLNGIQGIKVLDYPKGQGDPLKITIQSRCQYTGYELQKLFQKEGIFTELADPFNVLLIVPLLKKGMDFPFQTIIDKVEKLLKDAIVNDKRSFQHIFKKEKFKILQTFKAETLNELFVSLSYARGFISAETIIPYPPGVPLLLEGEKITEEDVHALQLLLQSGARFQGGEKLRDGQIKVYINGGQE